MAVIGKVCVGRPAWRMALSQRRARSRSPRRHARTAGARRRSGNPLSARSGEGLPVLPDEFDRSRASPVAAATAWVVPIMPSSIPVARKWERSASIVASASSGASTTDAAAICNWGCATRSRGDPFEVRLQRGELFPSIVDAAGEDQIAGVVGACGVDEGRCPGGGGGAMLSSTFFREVAGSRRATIHKSISSAAARSISRPVPASRATAFSAPSVIQSGRRAGMPAVAVTSHSLPWAALSRSQRARYCWARATAATECAVGPPHCR